ncbi:MAG: TolC family protein [Acidobacteriota bacterium]|nr:TolC family protein [Acidobacteriota bacterium]
MTLHGRISARTARPPWGVLALVAPLALATSLALAAPLLAEETTTDSRPPAEQRLLSSLEAALVQPMAQAAAARREAQRQEIHAGTAAAAPEVEWQSEGLDSSFGRELNAVDSLRLRKEVPLFGQHKDGRAVRHQADKTLEAAGRLQSLEIAGEAARAWLDLAVTLEQRTLAEHRLTRLDRALLIQRKRLELGEVAGAEVAQLELQRATDDLALRTLAVRQRSLEERLQLLAGDAPTPHGGDLAELVTSLPPVPAEPERSASPYRDAAEQQLLLAEREADWTRGRAWGLPELEFQIQRVPSLEGQSAFESYGLRLAVPLPLGRSGKARKAAAAARTDSANAEVRIATARLEQRLAESQAALQNARETLGELRPLEAELPSTEHSLAEQFRLGAVSYLVYIDGLARLDGLRSQLVDVRRALLQARLELGLLLASEQYFPLPPSLLEDPS